MSVKKNITTKELNDLIAPQAGVTPQTVRRVYKYLRYYIIKELKTHGRIRLEGIGTFKTIDYGGKDMTIPSAYGGFTKKFVEKSKRVSFSSSDIFTDCVNDKDIIVRGKKVIERTNKNQALFESDQLNDYEADIFDFADDYLAKRRAKKEKKNGKTENRNL